MDNKMTVAERKYVEERVEKVANLDTSKAKSFILIAENTKGNLVPVVAEIVNKDNEDLVQMFALKKGLKQIKVNAMTIDSLLNNSKIKGVYGSTPDAVMLKAKIEEKITLEQKNEAIDNAREQQEEDIKNVVINIVTEKMNQTVEEKLKSLEEKQEEEKQKTFMVLYKTKEGIKFLEAKILGEEILLEKEKIKVPVNNFVNDENVRGVYGFSETSTKMKEMIKQGGLRVAKTNEIERQKIVEELQEKNKEIEMPNQEVKNFLKGKESQKKPKNKIKR